MHLLFEFFKGYTINKTILLIYFVIIVAAAVCNVCLNLIEILKINSL